MTVTFNSIIALPKPLRFTGGQLIDQMSRLYPTTPMQIDVVGGR